MQKLILWNIIIIILSLNSVSFLPMIDSQTLQPQFNSNEPPEKQNKVYKKIKLLGSGSYAKAYLIQQISTSNLYVVKQINIFDMTNSQQQKVSQQAKILQLLNHPNIIKFKEIQTNSKMKLNIVMEYADGGDLAQKIKQAKEQNTYFDENLILNWFTQICLGIKHIHDRKIIHRDLKGHNIFLTSDNCVKIGDLGVATILQHTVAKAKTIVGTPYYMSPQIMQNKPYSFKTDIWSLGILLYQICTLSPPFTANNLQFLALKIVRGNYQAIPAQYSSQLKTLVRSMLNTNPNLRPNINQILSSPLINKRIKSLLNEQKNSTQFSQTNLLKFKSIKNEIEQKLRPPPNLIQIQQQNQNISAIIQAKKLYQNQIFGEVKAKTPNCIGKNPPTIKKKPISNDRKVRPSTAQNINDIMKIRATPLQQHIIAPKLPKVISPNLIKKQPQKLKQNPQSPKQHPLSHHIQTQKIGNNKNDNIDKDKIENKNKNAAINKRKSVDCTQYKKSQQQKVMMITKNFKKKNQKQILKPKQEQIYEQNQIKTKSQNYDNQLDEHCQSGRLAENISGYQNCNQGINKINLQIKSQLSSQNVKKSQKKITKPTSAKQKKPKINKPKQKKQQKQFKLELVSQELQKKQKSQKQKLKNLIKKQPLKKNKSTTKNVIHIQNNEHHIQQIVQQQKCNDASEDKYDYQQQQFEVYQQKQNQQIQQGSDFSFTLSDSSLHEIQPKYRILQEQGKANYLKMLAELQIITKMVDQAKGNIQNLPIIGAPLSQLLSLSQSQIKQKQSLIISNEDQNLKSDTMLNLGLSSNPTQNNQISSLKNTKSLINFACLNDQSQLQNLRIALQQIFGMDNIIKLYKFLEQIVEKYGLEFHQEDIIRKILKQCQGVQETCLRRHFRFIVTVIVIQKQIALGNFGK